MGKLHLLSVSRTWLGAHPYFILGVGFGMGIEISKYVPWAGDVGDGVLHSTLVSSFVDREGLNL